MAMVGLFWITEKSVYVGAEPAGYGPGVRLTADGVEALGADQEGCWAWADLRSVGVHFAPVRRKASGWKALSNAVDTALDVAGLVFGGIGDPPPVFEVHVETGDGTTELDAYGAAPRGYTESEYELSVTLLQRFVTGIADVSALLEWGRTHVVEGTLGREEREALLREWLEA
ncbi:MULTISPECIES: hypothetical protein [Streptomyces]|uniref:Uncharacterized protein n=1 Tax=Streptomyces acidicola TaxID=2596892 RepID=A0A5N8X307_9ACTN|nr:MULTISPECIES: hypothetical protein [Streptomyces]MBA2807826.1 hypothetical protein [Streptomyces sp. KM273126]MPY53957.1 hypothetical protein [Streptomyces acidicola]